MRLDKVSSALDIAGFNLFAVIGRTALGEFAESGNWKSLLLVGNAGSAMWRAMPEEYFGRDDPVDDYSKETVKQVMAQFGGSVEWQVLFPLSAMGSHCPPLQALGRLAGWHHDSPLGSGIHSRFGLWFAYRAVVALNAELESTSHEAGESPCLSCQSQACVSSCPADALSIGESPDMSCCAQYRMQPASRCAESCESRIACPVAAQWRYDTSQISYHYRLALPALGRWLADTRKSEQSDS